MSGRDSCPLNQGRPLVVPARRKSLLYRITDTISSFLPSFFESRDEKISENSMQTNGLETSSIHSQSYTAVDKTVVPRLSERLTVSQLNRVEIPETRPSKPFDSDVDLDAKDYGSEFSTESRTSVSTSGVSSLLPRTYRCDLLPVENRPSFQSSIIQHNRENRLNEEIYTNEIWTNAKNNKRASSTMGDPAHKRMRINDSQSELSQSISSPFYRGRVSYGGASSLRYQSKPQSVFDHVTPLRFIMEAPEDSNNSKNEHSSSKALLSATAQRILQSLESHSCPIASSDKIPLPDSKPSTPMPLQRSTTRYPAYMAAYKRHKESRKNNFPCPPNPLSPVLSTSSPDYFQTGTKHTGGGPVRHEKHSFSSVIPRASDSASSVDFLPPVPPKLLLQSVPTVILPTTQISRTSIADKINTTGPTLLSATGSTMGLSHKPQSICSAACQTSTFIFSNPTVVNSTVRPIANVAAIPHFTFSKPVVSFKRQQNGSSSFLPALLSPKQLDDHVTPFKNVVKLPENLNLWRCESCLTENSDHENMCTACRFPKCPQIKPPVDTWSCPSCMTHNVSTVSTCSCCRGSNRVSKPDGSTVSPVLDPPGFKFNPPKSTTSVGESSSVGSGLTTPAPFVTVPSSWSSDSSPLSSSSGLKLIGLSSQMSNDKWDCPTCMVQNSKTLELCACCKTANPDFTPSKQLSMVDPSNTSSFVSSEPGVSNAPRISSSSDNTVFRFGNISSSVSSSPNFKFGPSKTTAVPSVTFKFNQTESLKCGSPFPTENDNSNPLTGCQSPKPIIKKAPTIAFQSGIDCKWDCPTCLVSNDNSLDLCPCCQTKKPTISALTSEVNKWQCPTCMVENVASVKECPSCYIKDSKLNPISELPKTPQCITSGTVSPSVNSPPLIFSTVKPSFNFGIQKPQMSSASPSMLENATTFGSLAGSASVPLFSFSVPVQPLNSSASSSGFTLGYKSASSMQPIKPSTSVFKNGSFQFGSPSATPTFNFGATKENVTPATEMAPNSTPRAFNFPAMSAAPAPLFKFGDPVGAMGNSSGLFTANSSSTENSGTPSAPNQVTGVHGRPIRRAVRRQHRI